jgi:hypothetical protein
VWTVRPNNDTTIDLSTRNDGNFAWNVTANCKSQRLAGKWSLTDAFLTLAQAGQGGALVGHAAWQAADRWSFRVIGSGPEDSWLTFTH